MNRKIQVRFKQAMLLAIYSARVKRKRDETVEGIEFCTCQKSFVGIYMYRYRLKISNNEENS